MRARGSLSTLLLLSAVACTPDRGPGATTAALTNDPSFNPSNNDGNDGNDGNDEASTPTDDPSGQSTDSTTVNPTEDPTANPSEDPTANPSEDPTTDGPTTEPDPTNPTTPTTVDDTTNPGGCDAMELDISLEAPSVMLVLDKSGSMVADPTGYWDHDADPGTPNQTRWKSLHETVEFMVNTYNDSMKLGMNLFPSKSATSTYNETACTMSPTVEVKVAASHAPAVVAAMPAADATNSTIKGATPAAQAIDVAYSELLGADQDKPRYMVLVTDGAANCMANPPDLESLFEVYDEDLPVNVANAFQQGIPTYVVGIGIKNVTSNDTQDGNPDSTNSYQKLNEVAIAGGKPRAGADKFYDTQNQIELQEALEQIASDMIGCTVSLNPAPLYPDFLSLAVGGQEYSQVGDCGSQDGWHYTDQNEDRIELCGAACEDFQVIGSLHAQYSCPG